MSRDSKRRERLARRQAYRATSYGRVVATATSEDELRKKCVRLVQQLDAMPGAPEEKYVVFLKCSNNTVYSYPLFNCKDGFTAALQDAIRKHQSADRPQIEGGIVHGVGRTIFTPPDTLVQMIAAGANVLVTRRLKNQKEER